MNGVKNFSINKKSNGWLKFLIGGSVLLFFLWVLNIFVLPVKNSVYAVSYPIQKLFWTAGEGSSLFFGSFFKAGFLAKENEFLSSENQKLLAQIAFLQSVEKSAEAQNQASAWYQNNGFKFVMVGVVGLDDNDIISIDKGSADGIQEGMPVINQQNVLFGKITKVYNSFSKVVLISNKNSAVNVEVQKENGEEVSGVVKGEGGLSAYLDLIPISNEINSRDVLVTSAVDKSFPKNLLVARIVEKQKDDQKPFQQAKISLFFDVRATDNLFVITNYKR